MSTGRSTGRDTRRIVVTGIGVVSAFGATRSDFADGVLAGRTAIAAMDGELGDALGRPPVARAQAFTPEQHFQPRELPRYDRVTQLAIVAAREAMHDSKRARMTGSTGDDRAMVVFGTAAGGQTTLDDGYQQLYGQKRARVHPMSVPRTMVNAAACAVAADIGAIGPVYNVSTACASSTHALGQAYWLLRSGVADWALAGGSDAPLTLGHVRAWQALRVLAEDTCRPFSKGRSGTVLGEGAGALVLEELEHAKSRGARIYGELVGFGMSCDAGHVTQPSMRGPYAAMASALRDANLDAAQLDCIGAHGSGTVVSDAVEASAIVELCGARGRELPVSATKSLHGHTLGASGAMAVAATLLCAARGTVPPTANFLGPAEDCPVRVTAGAAPPLVVRYTLVNSFAFGGLNASLVLKTPLPAAEPSA